MAKNLKVTVTARVDKPLRTAVRKAAREMGTTPSRFIEAALYQAVRPYEERAKAAPP